jgi:phage-related protein
MQEPRRHRQARTSITLEVSMRYLTEERNISRVRSKLFISFKGIEDGDTNNEAD